MVTVILLAVVKTLLNPSLETMIYVIFMITMICLAISWGKTRNKINYTFLKTIL
ncbi:MAG: hypothetical protein UT02_C0049G0001 [Parcubacteria group bacterium GW2011_GWC2_38_7]|nr:MAG: hypothetical protein UT02_C0049G0001 [Parcubacteria group bacterium GW2011_GWC2_38_7]